MMQFKSQVKSCFGGFLTATALAFVPMAASAQNAGEHVITMQDVDIRSFINDVATVTGNTFIVDPRVQGRVTISSEQSLSKSEVFEVFKDVMRVHGYTLVRTATGEYRVTLLQGAAGESPFVDGNGINGRLATTVIKLNYEDAAEAARLIKPVMHSQGLVTANPEGNIIVITDFPENIRKAREIVAAMDTDGSVTEIIQLRQLSAIDAEEALKELAGQKPRVKVVAISGSNSLLIEGPPQDVARLRPVVESMDVGSIAPRGAVSVIPLRFANGATLVEVLTNLLPSYAVDGNPTPTVAYDSFSNTLIVSADAETQASLEGIIRRLDVRRPQVLVEAIIVEISDTAAKELGVQFAVGGINGNTVPLISSNFNAAPNILALTGALAGDEIGLNVDPSAQTAALNSLSALTGGTAGIGGISNDTLFGVIANALERDEESNILSTPFVTTLDNVPATFLVGQEIPITTGESLGSNNVNPFRTFERKEVGIKLNVLPQISEGDVVRLEIAQEVSSIAGAVTTISQDFVTNKRQIETTVLANNGEIIVLGGLLEDDEQITVEKIPLLGDAPLIGSLFRNKDKSRVKTNLMVFLRPTIIRDADDARPLTQSRLNRMRREDINQSGRDVSKIDDFISSGQ